MNELQGEESTEEIRRLVRDNSFLRGIRLTGTGRTNSVIVGEINQRIKISNLTAKVQALESNLNEMNATVNEMKSTFEEINQKEERNEFDKRVLDCNLNAITADIKSLNKKVKGISDLQRIDAANDNEKMRQMKARISRVLQSLNETKMHLLRLIGLDGEMRMMKGQLNSLEIVAEGASKSAANADGCACITGMAMLVVLLAVFGNYWFHLQLLK